MRRIRDHIIGVQADLEMSSQDGAYVFRQLVINDPWPNFNARTRELTTLRRTRNSKDKIFNMETFKRYTTSGLSC
jgi:hypothetical protein